MIDTQQKPGRIYTITSLDEAQVDTRVRGIAALTETQARDLTTQIQRTSVRLWLLVTEAHDRKAHVALGYETWADYVRAELSMSESRSYQLLDTGHVMKAMAAGGVNVELTAPPPARVVAKVKTRLADVKKAAARAIAEGESVDKAVRSLAREPKAPSGATANAASSTSTRRGRRPKAEEEQVSCPACAGSGKVTTSVADRLLALLKDL